jgi:hypothetical protein
MPWLGDTGRFGAICPIFSQIGVQLMGKAEASALWMAISIGIGLALGVVFGIVSGHLTIGAAAGFAIGAGAGLAVAVWQAGQ